MTAGIDLGDVWSHYCTLNQDGEVVDRGRFRTTLHQDSSSKSANRNPVESNEVQEHKQKQNLYEGKNKEQTLDTSDLLIESRLLGRGFSMSTRDNWAMHSLKR